MSLTFFPNMFLSILYLWALLVSKPTMILAISVLMIMVKEFLLVDRTTLELTLHKK